MTDYKCFADDCSNRVPYPTNYCGADCKYPDYEAKYAAASAELSAARKLVEPWFNDGDSLADTITVLIDANGHLRAALEAPSEERKP